MKFTYTLLLLLSLTYTKAQVTLIPDENFEQSLLDQNIDSDGTLNGQVFTSDISGLATFSLLNTYIEDLTGLEEFVALQHLSLENIFDFSSDNNSLDLSHNTNLETFEMFGGGDAINNNVYEIVLNNNPNINTINVPENWVLRQLDLKTGTTDVSNLDIDIHIVPFDLWQGPVSEFNDDLFCIKVTDAEAATAGTGVYSTWNINATDNPYYFSETCTLSTDRFNSVEVNLYPNPVTSVLHIETENIEFRTTILFNAQGKLIKEINNESLYSIDVSDLSAGLYILQLESEYGVLKKRFIKK